MGGATIDGGLYGDVARWGAGLPGWAGDLVSGWSAYGLALFAALMVWAWWVARRGPGRAMARTLASPVIVVVAYLVNEAVKGAIEERRPCRTLPGTPTLDVCPGLADWSFPSNHAVIAAAAAAALVAAVGRLRGGGRWIALTAVVAALLMGASRVVVGAHYPHDVWVGWIEGAAVGLLLGWAAGCAGPAVDRLRQGGLRPVLGPGDRP